MTDDWKPIHTAPKDRPVLVYGQWYSEIDLPTKNKEILVAVCASDKWEILGTSGYTSWFKNPTHWMELPSTPE